MIKIDTDFIENTESCETCNLEIDCTSSDDIQSIFHIQACGNRLMSIEFDYKGWPINYEIENHDVTCIKFKY